MDHRDHINDLLDGDLEAMHESTLFGELALNADLRSEFKQQLAIRSAVQNDRVALIPPVALTSSVFSGLGFAGPLAGAAAGAVGGSILSTWLPKVGIPLLAAATATAITWGVMQSDTPQQQAMQPQTQAPVGIQAAPQQPAVKAGETIIVEKPCTHDAQLAVLRRDNAALRAELDRTPSQPAVDQPLAEQNTERTEMPAVAMQPAQRVTLTNAMTLSQTSDQRVIQQTTLQPISMRSMMFPAFIVQMRGMSASSLVDVNAPAQSTWYENVGLGLLYQLSDNHAVGLEMGSEIFPMSFQGNVNGQVIQYQQQPQSMWAGAAYRYTLSQLGSSGFAPFGQVLLGGTSFGPLGRLTAGFQYSPAGPLSFMLGVEGTAMAYQFNSAWFSSSKLGLTYGVAVRF
jgi:hypothetical protein